MKGMNEMTVNSLVLRDALQEYFNKRLTVEGFLQIESVKICKADHYIKDAEATIIFKDTIHTDFFKQEKSA